MYIEKRYLRKIAKVFQELSLPLRLLDADGACIVPEDGPGIAVPASTLASGINHHVGDALVRVLDIHPRAVSGRRRPLRPARATCCALRTLWS